MEYLQQSFTFLFALCQSMMIMHTKGMKGKMAMKETQCSISELPCYISLDKMDFFADFKLKLAITFFSPNFLHSIGDQ